MARSKEYEMCGWSSDGSDTCIRRVNHKNDHKMEVIKKLVVRSATSIYCPGCGKPLWSDKLYKNHMFEAHVESDDEAMEITCIRKEARYSVDELDYV